MTKAAVRAAKAVAAGDEESEGEEEEEEDDALPKPKPAPKRPAAAQTTKLAPAGVSVSGKPSVKPLAQKQLTLQPSVKPPVAVSTARTNAVKAVGPPRPSALGPGPELKRVPVAR